MRLMSSRVQGQPVANTSPSPSQTVTSGRARPASHPFGQPSHVSGTLPPQRQPSGAAYAHPAVGIVQSGAGVAGAPGPRTGRAAPEVVDCTPVLGQINRGVETLVLRLEDLTATIAGASQKGGGGAGAMGQNAVRVIVPAGTPLFTEPVVDTARSPPLLTFDNDTTVLLYHPQESVGEADLWMLAKYAGNDLSVYSGWIQVQSDDGQFLALQDVSIAV